MSENASGRDVSDDLGALARASGDASPVHPPASGVHAQPGLEHEDDDDYITAEVEDESGADPASAPMHFHAAGSPGIAPRPLHVRSKKKNSELKAIAAPVLLTVGVLLLIPACWGLLVLAGASVPMSDREDASSMAKVMLICWPLALSLVLPALIFFGQLHAEKKRAAQVRSL